MTILNPCNTIVIVIATKRFGLFSDWNVYLAVMLAVRKTFSPYQVSFKLCLRPKFLLHHNFYKPSCFYLKKILMNLFGLWISKRKKIVMDITKQRGENNFLKIFSRFHLSNIHGIFVLVSLNYFSVSHSLITKQKNLNSGTKQDFYWY